MSWPGPGTSFPGLASSPWHLVKYLVCTSQFKRNDCWMSENKHYKQTFEHRNLSNQILFLHSFWTHSSLILWKFLLVEGPTEKLTTRSTKAAAQNFMVAVIHSTCSPAPHPTVGPWKGKRRFARLIQVSPVPDLQAWLRSPLRRPCHPGFLVPSLTPFPSHMSSSLSGSLGEKKINWQSLWSQIWRSACLLYTHIFPKL